MNIEVRYQSRGGNTRAVADLIANGFDVAAKSIDSPIKVYTDVLFLGGGVYNWGMDKALREYMEGLDPQKIGQIVCFSSTGYMSSTITQMKEIAKEKGIAVNKNELLVKMLLKGHSWLGLEGGKLSDNHATMIHDFTEKIRGELQ